MTETPIPGAEMAQEATNLPDHVRRAIRVVNDGPPRTGTMSAEQAVSALHRAGLLAGDRDCTCNRTEDGDRLVTHQRGDVAFCRDYFEPLTVSEA